jgi:hypothetical protein
VVDEVEVEEGVDDVRDVVLDGEVEELLVDEGLVEVDVDDVTDDVE